MLSRQQMVLTISGVLAVLVIAGLIWPLAEQRNRSIDRAIERDFSAISSLVDTHFSEQGRLPDEIGDLPLGKDALSRAVKYDYSLDKNTSRTYELCANFKTDNTDTDGDYATLDYARGTSSQTHTDGYDCIEYEVFGYYYDDLDGFNIEDSVDFPASPDGVESSSAEI